jgi:hypothetical protein
MAYPSVGNIFNPLQNNATGNIQSAFPTAMKPVMPTPAPSVSAPISTPPVSSKVSKKIPKDKYQKMLDDAQKE